MMVTKDNFKGFCFFKSIYLVIYIITRTLIFETSVCFYQIEVVVTMQVMRWAYIKKMIIQASESYDQKCLRWNPRNTDWFAGEVYKCNGKTIPPFLSWSQKRTAWMSHSITKLFNWCCGSKIYLRSKYHHSYS